MCRCTKNQVVKEKNNRELVAYWKICTNKKQQKTIVTGLPDFYYIFL